MHRRRRPQQTNQFIDTNGVTASDVVDFADFVTFGNCDQRINDIADEGEIPGLLTIADDREGLAGEKLGAEKRRTPPHRFHSCVRADRKR